MEYTVSESADIYDGELFGETDRFALEVEWLQFGIGLLDVSKNTFIKFLKEYGYGSVSSKVETLEKNAKQPKPVIRWRLTQKEFWAFFYHRNAAFEPVPNDSETLWFDPEEFSHWIANYAAQWGWPKGKQPTHNGLARFIRALDINYGCWFETAVCEYRKWEQIGGKDRQSHMAHADALRIFGGQTEIKACTGFVMPQMMRAGDRIK